MTFAVICAVFRELAGKESVFTTLPGWNADRHPLSLNLHVPRLQSKFVAFYLPITPKSPIFCHTFAYGMEVKSGQLRYSAHLIVGKGLGTWLPTG